MIRTHEEILADTIDLLRQLAEDWEYNGKITRDTYLIADMGFESLEVVILSAKVQMRYGQTLPFAEFFEEIGQREVRDISVGEWVDFVYHNLNGTSAQVTPEGTDS